MIDILKRFKLWEWAVIAINLLTLTANLIVGEFGVAWSIFVIVVLFTMCAVWRVMYTVLDEENEKLLAEIEEAYSK